MTTHNELRELVAVWRCDKSAHAEAYRWAADELESLLTQSPVVNQGSTADGWVVVPREPTEAMVAAAVEARERRIQRRIEANDGTFAIGNSDAAHTMLDTYRAMLAAAPAAPVAEFGQLSPRQLDEYAQDLRHLIVCDTQFGWTGETNLQLPEITRLVERGWVEEGEENAEFDVTDEGQLVIERALRAGPRLEYDESCPYGAPNCASADDATNCHRCAADIASAASPAVEVDEASVRQIIAETIGFGFEAGELQTVNADDLMRLAAALGREGGGND